MNTLSRADLVKSAISRLRGRYIVIAGILLVSTGVSVFAAALGSYGASQTDATSASTGALRLISVYPDKDPLTDASIKEINSMRHVAAATPFIRTTGMLVATGEDFSMVGVSPDMLPPALLDGKFGFGSKSRSWVVLPASTEGNDHGQDIGRTISLELTKALDADSGTNYARPFVVTGVADPSYQVDAPNAAYVDLDVAKELYLTRHGLRPADLTYDKVTLQVDSQDHVPAVVAELQGQGMQAVSRLQELETVPAVISIMRLLGLIVAIALGLLSVMVTGLQTVALMRQRTPELGVLRATGWQPSVVVRTWTSEVVVVASASVIAGTLLGSVAAIAVGNRLREKFSDGVLGGVVFGPGWLLPSLLILLTCLLTAAVTIRSSARREIAVLMRTLA